MGTATGILKNMRTAMADRSGQKVAIDDSRLRIEAEPDRFVPSLHGCDPIVFQTERKLSAGKTHWSATHAGRLYFFASAASRDHFQTDPARFAVDLKIQFFREQEKEVSMR